MTDFFLTQMGQRFYESTMPGLVKQLADLNENLRKQNEPEIKADPNLCSKHGGCGFQSDCAKCRHEEHEEKAASSGAASIREEEDKAILDIDGYRLKLKLVNDKLGIKMEDSFEHFREQLNNALDDD